MADPKLGPIAALLDSWRKWAQLWRDDAASYGDERTKSDAVALTNRANELAKAIRLQCEAWEREMANTAKTGPQLIEQMFRDLKGTPDA